MSKIEFKLPIHTHQNEFSEEFIKKGMENGLVNKIIVSIEYGVSPFEIIEMLAKAYDEALNKLGEISRNGIPPIVFQVTPTELEEIKNRINGEGN